MTTSATTPYPLATWHEVQAIAKSKGPRAWVFAALLVGVLIVIGVVIGHALHHQPRESCTDPAGCGRPPQTPPLSPSEPYTSAAFGYSLDQQSGCPRVKTVEDARSIGWVIAGRWPVTFTAEPARGRSAVALVEAIHQSTFSDARFLFSIPGTHIGYTPGEGRVYDYLVTTGSGQSIRARVILMVAIKKDIAIEVISVGPFEPSAQENYSHPNPQETPIGECFGAIANSVVWPGDPPL